MEHVQHRVTTSGYQNNRDQHNRSSGMVIMASVKLSGELMQEIHQL